MFPGLAVPWSHSALLQGARMGSSCFPAGLCSRPAGGVCLLGACAGELLYHVPWMCQGLLWVLLPRRTLGPSLAWASIRLALADGFGSGC